MLDDWMPLLHIGFVDGEAFHEIELSEAGRQALAANYSQYLLMVNPDATIDWIANAELNDPETRARLGRLIYNGGTLMRLNYDGTAGYYFYPTRNLRESKVMILQTNGMLKPFH